MATLGDPLMELGTTLAYWAQADDDRFTLSTRRQPTHLPGMLTRREIVDYYCGKMNLTPNNWAFYEVYGLFRLAAIIQQIYFRSEEHTSELRSLMRISYAVFCLKKKKEHQHNDTQYI